MLPNASHTPFCSMVHNAHNSSFHDPQCTRIRTTPALHYVPFFFPTHTCHNAPACFYLLTSSPPARAFPGSEHKKKKTYGLKETKTIACVWVCKNALERERGIHTHTGQRNMVKSFFFFFFPLFCFRALQSNLVIFL